MKRALVTGGTGVIGRAVCQDLSRQGLHVYVHANHHVQMANDTVEHIIQSGGSAERVVFDVCDEQATNQALNSILQEGPIQILINNAGIFDDAPMAGMSSQQWNRVIDVSLNGFFHVTQPLLLPMIRTRWGRIINISSLAGMVGHRGQTNYSAAKAGLHGASKALAIEVGSRGITVNVVAPGLIASPAIEKTFSQQQVETLVPMKRTGRAEEVAHLVTFLASDHAAYISGQIIGINGAIA